MSGIPLNIQKEPFFPWVKMPALLQALSIKTFFKKKRKRETVNRM